MTDDDKRLELLNMGMPRDSIAQLSGAQLDFVLGHELMHKIITHIMNNKQHNQPTKLRLTITLDADAVMHEDWGKLGSELQSWGRELAHDGVGALGRWSVGDNAYMEGGYADPTIKLDIHVRTTEKSHG